MEAKKILPKAIRTLIIGVIAVLFLLPLLWMISASFKAPLEVFEYPIKWIPEIFHFENYVQVWTDEVIPFWRLYGNSLFIVFFSLLGQLLFASLACYAFAKLDFKGKNWIFIGFLAAMMIPTQATIIPRYMLFRTIGLYDNLWAIIFPTWFDATAIFMLRPVSYTHLDVYKRQGKRYIESNGFTCTTVFYQRFSGNAVYHYFGLVERHCLLDDVFNGWFARGAGQCV